MHQSANSRTFIRVLVSKNRQAYLLWTSFPQVNTARPIHGRRRNFLVCPTDGAECSFCPPPFLFLPLSLVRVFLAACLSLRSFPDRPDIQSARGSMWLGWLDGQSAPTLFPEKISSTEATRKCPRTVDRTEAPVRRQVV